MKASRKAWKVSLLNVYAYQTNNSPVADRSKAADLLAPGFRQDFWLVSFERPHARHGRREL